MPDPVTSLTFDQVLSEELTAIEERRRLFYKDYTERKRLQEGANNSPPLAGAGQSVPPQAASQVPGGGEYQRLKEVRKRALRSHLVGVAFSGGGIRSATFAVGILQGLATLRLLGRIDYLSTVSGGGWAGAWLAAWLKREGSVTNVEEQLATSRVRQSQAERPYVGRDVLDEEPEPIYHLRAYSRFLAPRSGVLTADTWSLVTTYLRNVTINLSILLPSALALVFFVRIMARVCGLGMDDAASGLLLWIPMAVCLVAGAAFFMRGFLLNAKAVNYIRLIQDGGRGRPAVDGRRFVFGIVVPLVAAVFYLTVVVLRAFRKVWHDYIDRQHRPVAPAPHRSGGGGARSSWGHYIDWLQDQSTPLSEWFTRHLWPGGLAGLDEVLGFPDWVWDHRANAIVAGLLAAVALLGAWGVGRAWSRRAAWHPGSFLLLVFPLVIAVLLAVEPAGGGDGRGLFLLRVVTVLTCALIFGALMALIYFFETWFHASARRFRLLWSAFFSGFVGGALLGVVAILALRSRLLHGRGDLVATFGTPAGLLVLVVATFAHVGELGSRIGELEREWWARLDACLLIAAIGWVAVFEVVLYLPAAVVWIGDDYVRTGVIWGLVTSWVGTTAAGVLAGSSARTGGAGGSPRLEAVASVAPPAFLIGLFGLLGVVAYALVDGPLPTGGAGHGLGAAVAYFAAINGSSLRALAVGSAVSAAIALFIARRFEVNLFSLNAMYANRLARCYLGASRRMSGWARRWAGGGDPGAGGGAPTAAVEFELPAPDGRRGWFSRESTRPHPNPNALRRPHPVTGFELNDDIPLVDLRIGKSNSGSTYPGPQLLINTSLNLVAGTELAWTDRKSESFFLSPLHCGSKGTGYAAVTALTRDHLSIARAIAISGAAVDPNMNYHQSPALTAFLTIFNARLGYWLENPRRPVAEADEAEAARAIAPLPGRHPAAGGPPADAVEAVREARRAAAAARAVVAIGARLAGRARRRAADDRGTWKAESPRHGGLLFAELLGGTGREDEFVHLTDGGHFENTGVYELIRRRCRHIVACDANTDRTAADENLANLVRLVRIDFGIRIEIDTTPLKVDDDRTCRAHVAIGSVRYDDVDSGQVPGILVYIRTSMTGDEPPDIRNYATVNDEFPYTSSANQFFDEAQFESYRALGDHIARVVFEDAKDDADRIPAPTGGQPDAEAWFRRNNRQLFAALRRRWAESMPDQDARFLESSQGYSELQRDLQAGGPLRGLSLEVYPELNDLGRRSQTTAGPAAAPGQAAEDRRVELHAVARMLQVMENTWVGLDLKSHPEAPISHGWWSVFRRWTATAAFHRNWPILRPEFSTEYVRFIESRLGLMPELPEIISWSDPSLAQEERHSLTAEYDREWPKNPRGEHTSAMSLAEMIARAGDRVWAIVQRPKPKSGGSPAASDLRGVMLVMEASSLHPPDHPRKDKPLEDRLGPYWREFEIVVWIRRSHRGIGLGTYALESKPDELLAFEQQWRGRATLFARYPKVEDDVVPSMWKRFFALYDFQTEAGAETEGNVPLILHRDL